MLQYVLVCFSVFNVLTESRRRFCTATQHYDTARCTLVKKSVTYIYIYIYIHMNICIYIYIYMCIIHIHVYICTYVCIYICIQPIADRMAKNLEMISSTFSLLPGKPGFSWDISLLQLYYMVLLINSMGRILVR